MIKSLRFIDVAIVAMVLMVVAVPSFAVVVPPNLGASANYTVLDSTTPNASQARSDFATAFNYVGNQACTTNVGSQDLNNQRLTPGVYCFNSSTLFNGWWTLDAQNDPNAVFIFKLVNQFTIADASRVILTGGAQPRNIFWQVNGPVRFGTGTRFAGTVLTSGDITVASENVIEGRLFSFGTVMLGTSNTITLLGGTTGTPTPFPQPAPFGGSLLTVTHLDPNFALFVNGFRVVSGQPTPFPPGIYTISEVNLSSVDYAPPTYTGDCVQNGFNATVILSPGDQKVCVVNNVVPFGSGVYVQPGFPGFPNTGGGGEYLMLMNAVGALLVGAFGWQELVRKGF